MAGSVGGAVVGCPGYAGYIPSSQQPLTCTNSTVSERMPLINRRQVSQRMGTKGPMAVSEAEIIRDPTGAFMPKRTTEGTLYSSASSYRQDPGDWTQPKTKTKLLMESQKGRESYTRTGPAFNATSLYGSNTMEKNKAVNFYSKVQQQEVKQGDEELTKTLHNTRSSAKQHIPTAKKHELRMNATLGLEDPQFEATERRKMLGAEPVSASEFVKFKGAHESKSSAQKEYGTRGFVPLASIPATVEGMSQSATTSDLFAGTTKSALGLRIPGYMGHVPNGKASKDKMRRTTPDLLKQNSQNVRLISTSKRTLPGYSGYEPKSLENDRGRPNRPDLNTTSSGAASATILADSEEKAMNKTTFAKQGGIRNFFTQGGGQPDHSISEQYFVKYRPMEGCLKMGARTERAIPIAK
eukprot:TRINITY_DN29154_c0_g1_i1.p1 TRINITY_DN29154_c0_g1~~TRINITY_DN29154_c0_g1_i1.p1  ORF type:complete len:410 (+),score=90.53 TRINITY_DN29154_c0_g1_i1:51-1280(+)